MSASGEITYAVVQHSSGPQGGHVVRTMYDGWLPAPYSDVVPLRVYRRERDAQRFADKLYEERFGIPA